MGTYPEPWATENSRMLTCPAASPSGAAIGALGSIGMARSSTEFGNWSVSQPFCGSPRFASMLPKIPLAIA